MARTSDLARIPGWRMVAAMKRVVEPEILDELSADDPAAIASRRDLERINFLMGNERWILAQVAAMPEAAKRGIVEWGAGGGRLLERLAKFGPATGVDRVGRPDRLSRNVGWEQGDVFESGGGSGGILVANLFLHHFEDEALRRLGGRMSGFDAMVFVEPLRTRESLLLGSLMLPVVSPVTRHDMPVSIRAGFREGELAGMLGLDPAGWDVCESATHRGGLRWRAIRRTMVVARESAGASLRP